MSLITPDFGLIFWMTLIFAIVFFVLAKWGFPMIVDSVDQRSRRINESIRLAKEAELKLRELADRQKEMLEETSKEQARILKETSAIKDSIIAQAKEQAQVEAAKLIEHAREDISSERDAVLSDIRSQVASLSVEVAEKILRKSLEDDKSQMELLNTLVDELTEAEKEKI